MFECVMGLRDFNGTGCILADDMGLGKTLQAGADTRPLLSSTQAVLVTPPVSPGLIDWGEISHPTYPTKCAYVEPKSGRV